MIGCGPAADRPETGSGDGATGVAHSELASSLSVQVEGDTVALALHVTNTGESAVELEFATGQRYDFVIRDEAGQVVWSWAADRMFPQALGAERLEPGETVRYEAVWLAEGRQGGFEAEGRLVVMDRPIERRTEFRIGGS